MRVRKRHVGEGKGEGEGDGEGGSESEVTSHRAFCRAVARGVMMKLPLDRAVRSGGSTRLGLEPSTNRDPLWR